MSELTAEQKNKVDTLYSVKHMAIKKIAKELHVSDKRISAYLNGRKVQECANKAKPESKGSAEHAKNPKQKLVHKLGDALMNALSRSYEVSSDFIASMAAMMDVLMSTEADLKKAGGKKAVERGYKRVHASFVKAVSAISAATMLAMPSAYKKMFIESMGIEPQSAKKVAKAKPCKK